MKNRGTIFLITFIAIMILSVSFATAIDSIGGIENTAGNLENKINEGKQTLEDAKSNFLWTSWASFLQNRSLNGDKTAIFITETDKTLVTLNPIFENFMGVTYSLSWIFIITMVLWIGTAIITYKAIKESFEDYTWGNIAISIIIPSIVFRFDIIKNGIAQFAGFFSIDSWIKAVIFTITLICLLYIINKLLRIYRYKSKLAKRKERLREAKMAEKTIEKTEGKLAAAISSAKLSEESPIKRMGNSPAYNE